MVFLKQGAILLSSYLDIAIKVENLGKKYVAAHEVVVGAIYFRKTEKTFVDAI